MPEALGDILRVMQGTQTTLATYFEDTARLVARIRERQGAENFHCVYVARDLMDRARGLDEITPEQGLLSACNAFRFAHKIPVAQAVEHVHGDAYRLSIALHDFAM